MLRMKTIAEIRYENLERLVLDAAGPGKDVGKGLTKLVSDAAMNGKKLSRPMLYQVLTKKETAAGTVRNVGDDLARAIEDALRLERGWMDNEHGRTPAKINGGVSPDEIAELVTVFCYTNNVGREAIKSAIKIARSAIQGAAGDNLQRPDVAALRGEI